MEYKPEIDPQPIPYTVTSTQDNSGLTPNQSWHMNENIGEFAIKYRRKYKKGQKQHGGNLWEMGLYQVIDNLDEEVEDQWSYARQIRECVNEIKALCEDSVEVDSDKILNILNRIKKD